MRSSVRNPGQSSQVKDRVKFGATIVAEVPSWKEENSRMNFRSVAHAKSPRKEEKQCG